MNKELKEIGNTSKEMLNRHYSNTKPLKVYKVCFERVLTKKHKDNFNTIGKLGENLGEFSKEKFMLVRATDFESAEKEVLMELEQFEDRDDYQIIIFNAEELTDTYVSRSWGRE